MYRNTEKLAKMIVESGAQAIFMTPTIYDQTAKIATPNKLGVNDALKDYSRKYI